nr:chorismate-binding protein [Desulfosarcina cetonica]
MSMPATTRLFPHRRNAFSGSAASTWKPVPSRYPSQGKDTRNRSQMRAELAGSPKDDAELSMIVDLMRNDIGRVCCGGSVVVTQHKRLEAYQNVHHLVSVVEGRLAEGRHVVDLIRATFPGGSITGCPKIRCMEIIDELEPRQRHVYTGSIGYISFHDTMDLSIAIRTATVVDGRIYFSVGGGIVMDSDPADEYAETLHKGETLMRVFQGGDRPSLEPAGMPWAWHNGRLVPQDEAMVPISDLGLQYGFGFFETLRVEKGNISHLTAHLERFARTWAALFDGPLPDLTWEAIISQVIVKNGLESTTAAVKLLATRGAAGVHRAAGALVVTARPYVHRLRALGQEGLNLITETEPRASPLADHKTLNYLFYYQPADGPRPRGATKL